MKTKHDPLAGKTVHVEHPGVHCRHVATATGNFYVPVDDHGPPVKAPPAPASNIVIMPAPSDEARRALAKGLLKSALLHTVDDQTRYEVAFQALNRNLAAMQLCQEEATARGMSVEELAQQIIDERQVKARRTMHAHAVLARVLAEIDKASGDAIDQAAASGIAEIEGME